MAWENFLPLVGTFILYILTIWIPYINVGTTLGLNGVVLQLANKKKVEPLEIFKEKYRERMGELLLLVVFAFLSVYLGFVLLLIPGIVIALSWFFAFLLFIDKKLSPLEVLKKSNEVTYGHKWTIFGALFSICILFAIASFIISFFLEGILGGVITTAVLILLYVYLKTVLFSAHAYLYRVLK